MFYKWNLSTRKKNQSIYPRLAMNERQILQPQGKLRICFMFGLKRLSDSEFLISKEIVLPNLRTPKGDCINTIFYSRFVFRC